MSIADAVTLDIHSRLDTGERGHNVHIVLCCESGIRAWGFASSDSDGEERFFY